MSLTTVAAPVLPDENLARLPPSRPESFERSDFIAAGLVFLITFGVYIATLAPNVTLEDSGELVTAATKFGVGHPPGYPLWTMSGFLFSHLFPFGNLAWRINLQSAFYGAIANSLLTLLVCHSGRWLLQRWTDAPVQPVVRPFCFYAGLLAGLILGFSDVMWSQAVISAVHGTVNALFTNLTILLFYFWMIDPRKTDRLILTVFVFALGLTHHHTLIQIIPAILLSTALLREGKFWSVFIAVNLFSLSILVYLSWLSSDAELRRISEAMARLIFGMTALVSFFYLGRFRWSLFLLGVINAVLIFAYGHYILGPGQNDTARVFDPGSPFWRWGTLVHPGWLQIETIWGLIMLEFGALALGLLFTSNLDRRLILGVFLAGWVGLSPYAYEPFASSTHPPMNWGYASERSGFYYAVSREQYPMSLPNLIKSTIGKAIRVVAPDEQKDVALSRPDYFRRLWLTFYYYGDNLQQNFTVPLIFLILATLLYLRRCDSRQVDWFVFLGLAFFFIGFMLHLIEPPEAFDFERNLQYKVFHLQSHCIFVLLMGYGALAGMVYLYETFPDAVTRMGTKAFGIPALFLSLLPLWSNFDDCNKAGHWFGYQYGYDMMKPMEKNAVYFGGSDPGRFVPTFMAFVESQQDNRWKRDPNFDRRDITVITQNALCDVYYCHYIRDQYDPRFRTPPDQFTPFEKWLGRDKAYPESPVTCISKEELEDCWREYESLPDVSARVKAGGPLLRTGSNDVFDVNAIVAQHIFEKNKKNHTFYIEQSVPLNWTYPYLLPSGLIFKFNPEPLDALPPSVVQEDYRYWDAYSARLLQDPKFVVDDNASATFGKLALWHADLYRWRKMDKEEEHWLKIALALCPKLSGGVDELVRLLSRLKRFDEAIAVVKQAKIDDPRNESYDPILEWLIMSQTFDQRESIIRADLKKSPNDVQIHLQLARLLDDEGKFDELDNELRIAAAIGPWNQAGMADVVHYYVDKAHNPGAAIAFLEVRAKLDPKASEMIYFLAGLHAGMGHKGQAMKYLDQAVAVGGTNAIISASVDPRFESMHDDPGFLALLDTLSSTNSPANAPATKPATEVLPKPVHK